jgi:DNA-binding NarL/FixJ family response regulator
MRPITILIADDHALMRDGLRMILGTEEGISIVGEATSGLDAVAKADALKPDVILMDIAMPEMNGIEACRLISRSHPDARIIMLSMHNTREHVFQALRCGACGYLLKESAGSEIIQAVYSVMKKTPYYGKGVEPLLDNSAKKTNEFSKSPIESLSYRERQILQQVVDGKTSAEIAAVLSLSSKSVDTYRSRLMLKLGTRNVVSLIKFAIQNGITPDA